MSNHKQVNCFALLSIASVFYLGQQATGRSAPAAAAAPTASATPSGVSAVKPSGAQAAPLNYVNDYASVLRARTVQSLATRLADFDRQTADHVVIMIYPSLPAKVPVGNYAQQLYTSLKLGGPRDTGVLILIAVKDQTVRIQPGKGLAAKLPETTCRKIFTDVIEPRLDSNDFDGGCRAGVDALIQAISGTKSS
jgi:uncharacterized membrane protein YgcG